MRLLIAFLFSVIISSTGIFYGEKYADKKIKDSNIIKSKPNLSKIEYLNSDIYAYPVIKNKNLIGFFICKYIYEINAEIAFSFEVDESAFLSDIFYQSAFESQIFILEGNAVPDVAKVADLALAKSNESHLSKRYLNVLIQQVDYFERTEVRRKIVEEREVGG